MRRAADASGADDRVRVLVLGGWSPGPLEYLRDVFCGRCVFVEPALHMPPHGARWCCTWECVLLTAAIGLVCFGPSHFSWTWAGIAILCGSIAALPLLVVLLVRGSIRRSIAAANRAITHDGIEIVVGFSWGGGIGCWLLRDRTWAGPTLLLAPTLNAMASAAKRRVPVPFFRAAADADVPGRTIHIFHATFDGFCPEAQQHTLAETGATMHLCRDGHTLDLDQTLSEVGEAFASLLNEALSRRA